MLFLVLLFTATVKLCSLCLVVTDT